MQILKLSTNKTSNNSCLINMLSKRNLDTANRSLKMLRSKDNQITYFLKIKIKTTQLEESNSKNKYKAQ